MSPAGNITPPPPLSGPSVVSTSRLRPRCIAARVAGLAPKSRPALHPKTLGEKRDVLHSPLPPALIAVTQSLRGTHMFGTAYTRTNSGSEGGVALGIGRNFKSMKLGEESRQKDLPGFVGTGSDTSGVGVEWHF